MGGGGGFISSLILSYLIDLLLAIIDYNGTVSNIFFGNNNDFWGSFAATTLPFPPKLVAFNAENRKLQKNFIDTLVDITTKIRKIV